MGIQGLTRFIKERFVEWFPVNYFREWDHLIIDGSGICYALYYNEKYRWDLGGEYEKFSFTVEKFFREAHFRKPIVLFDGCAGHDEKKIATARSRRVGSMREMERVQCSGIAAKESMCSKPLMLISAFMDVLRSLDIEFHVVDGEADNAIAALANHYKCPVLGTDSDYFMFQLDHGFILFDRYYREMNNASLYKIQEFMRQFHLRQYDLCLILPSIFGNDFVKASVGPKSVEAYRRLLHKLSSYKTCREYLLREGNETVRDSFECSMKFYCHLPLPAALHVQGAPTTNQKFTVLPDWVFSSFKKGRFPPSLINVYHNKLYLLPLVVEVIEKESAWLISKHVRQLLYGFMGLPAGAQVKEIIRGSFCPMYNEEIVLPQCSPVSISGGLFTDRNLDMLSDLVLSVFDYPNKHAFHQLDGKWKLPIAATFYWYKHLANTSPLQKIDMLKALLLSFFMCSKDMELDPVPSHHLNGARCDHLTALHAFAQWQCVYYDARALNYLAREPFPTTSPACLYSGEVAMHYATIISHEGDWLTNIIAKGSNKGKQFNNMLCLVTGDV